MQNTENGGGEAELAEIAAKYDEEIAAMDAMIPEESRRSISTRETKENDRFVMRFPTSSNMSEEDVRADMMAQAAAEGIDLSKFNIQVREASDMPGRCAQCGKVQLVKGKMGHKLRSCQRCGAVQYCNTDCQVMCGLLPITMLYLRS